MSLMLNIGGLILFGFVAVELWWLLLAFGIALITSLTLLQFDKKLYTKYVSETISINKPEKRLTLFAFIVFAAFVTGWICIFISQNQPHVDPRNAAYNAVRDDIQNAVAQYASDNYGVYPTIYGTVTINGTEYNIIDIYPLLTSEGGLLREVPDGVISINGSDNDNCDNGCEGCYEDFSYIWAIDDEGNVYSTCIGKDCTASGEDGYQDVWP